MRGDGTTLQAFAGTLGTWVHAGLSPATPNHDYQAPIGQYGYDPNLATDATNRTVMAWYSSASGHLGVLAQDVGADGSPGRRARDDAGHERHAGRHARPHAAGGARRRRLLRRLPDRLPGANRVRVWRVGASNAPLVARVAGSAAPRSRSRRPATGGCGSLWTKGFGDPDVLAAPLEQERDEVRRRR